MNVDWDGILSAALIVVILSLGFAGDIERVVKHDTTVASK